MAKITSNNTITNTPDINTRDKFDEHKESVNALYDIAIQPTTSLTPTIAGQPARIELLTSINQTTPTPLVIYFHGSSETQNEAFTQIDEKRVTDKLIANGYIVASSAAGGSLWGNQAAQDHYYNLYDYIKNTYNIATVIFIGQSMGGLTSLNLLASGRVPVKAWYGIYPVTNLNEAYYNEGFSGNIESAYGFSGSANYSAATAGFDPQLKDVVNFVGIRFMIIHSYDDNVVFRETNADLFSSKLGSKVLENRVVTSLGDHGDYSSFLPEDILEFANKSKPDAFMSTAYLDKGLQINNSASDLAGIGSYLQLDNKSTGSTQRQSILQLGAGGDLVNFMYDGTTHTEKFRLKNSTGNLGLGTNPYSKLDVNGTLRSIGYQAPTSGTGLEMSYYAPGGYGQIYVYDRSLGAYKDLYLGSGGIQLVLKANGNIYANTSTGINGGGALQVEGDVNINGKFKINGASIGSFASAPASSTSPGIAGEVRYTTDYIYVCVATNTWKRSPLATW